MGTLRFKKHIFICVGPDCKDRGSQAVRAVIRAEILSRRLCREVKETPCLCFGMCEFGPNIVIYPDGVWYRGVTPADAKEIFASQVLKGVPVERLTLEVPD